MYYKHNQTLNYILYISKVLRVQNRQETKHNQTELRRFDFVYLCLSLSTLHKEYL